MAAATSSSTDGRTRIEDYSEWLSAEASRRKPSAIRALMPLIAANPGLISLGGGMPNPSLFPITGLSVEVEGETVKLDSALVQAALQYSPTAGLPELVSRLTVLQTAEHAPPQGDFSVMVGTGGQDLLSKAFHAILDETTPIITETPTYSGSVAALDAIGCPVIGIPSAADGSGMSMDALEAWVDAFEQQTSDDDDEEVTGGVGAGTRLRRPRAIYIIPTASNPTGATLPLSSRRRLYECARRLRCLILEDDPYRFLQFQSGDKSAVEEGEGKTIPSLLSLDTDGRVLRFDSLSKVVSAGMRLGFVTGPSKLVHLLNLDSQSSCLHTSGVSQAVALALLRHWGVGEDASDPLGAMKGHLRKVRAFYCAQRDACLAAVRRHLDGLARVYAEPEGGMFLWIEVLGGVEDTYELVKERAAAEGVLMVPGSAFLPGTGGKHTPSRFVRASYSIATPEQMDEAFARFAKALHS